MNRPIPMDPQSSDSIDGWVGALVILFYLLPVFLLVATWLIGRAIERKHFRNLAEREARWSHIPTVAARSLPNWRRNARSSSR